MTIPDALRDLADRLAHADKGERFPKQLTAEAVGTLVAAAEEVEHMEAALVKAAEGLLFCAAMNAQDVPEPWKQHLDALSIALGRVEGPRGRPRAAIAAALGEQG